MAPSRTTLCVGFASLGVAVALQAPQTTPQRCATALRAHSNRRTLLQGGIGVASALVTPAFARTGSLMDSKKKSNYG